MTMDWADYTKQVQQDINHEFEQRLELLKVIQDYFQTYASWRLCLLGQKDYCGFTE